MRCLPVWCPETLLPVDNQEATRNAPRLASKGSAEGRAAHEARQGQPSCELV